MAPSPECSDLRELGCRVLEAAMNATTGAEARGGRRRRPDKATLPGLTSDCATHKVGARASGRLWPPREPRPNAM